MLLKAEHLSAAPPRLPSQGSVVCEASQRGPHTPGMPAPLHCPAERLSLGTCVAHDLGAREPTFCYPLACLALESLPVSRAVCVRCSAHLSTGELPAQNQSLLTDHVNAISQGISNHSSELKQKTNDSSLGKTAKPCVFSALLSPFP